MFLSRTSRIVFIVTLAAGVSRDPLYAQGQPSPQITVDPATGLADGQTVAVSGTGFQADQDVALVECGAEVTTPPFIGATCTYYTVSVRTDAEGNFGPVNFTVTTAITGARWAKGHYIPASHTCAATEDCYVHAFSLSRGLRSANRHLGFAE